MRGFQAIALREIVERRMLLLLALALGLLSVLLPLLPFIRKAGSVTESRDLLAWVLACGFSGGLAIVLGASVVGRDLSEGRLGFFFSRPVSGLSLWAGKFAGALLLSAAVAFLTLLPATILGGGLLVPILHVGPIYEIGLEGRVEAVWLYASLAALLLFLLAVAHAVSVAIRSRSAWIALDLAGVCGAALVVLLIGRELLLRWAVMEAARLSLWLAGGVLLALLAGGAAQVCAGRTDVKRGHRALSLALWLCVAVCLGAVGFAAARYLDVPAAKLRLVWVSRPPQGEWVSLSGTAHSEKDEFYATFLLNVRTGATIDLGRPAWDNVEFSPDGKSACWSVPTGGPWKPAPELVMADLRGDRPITRQTGIVLNGFLMDVLFSPHGERIAYADDQTVSVLESDSLKSVASFRLPIRTEGRWWLRGHFMSRDLLRLYLMESEEGKEQRRNVTILEFSLPAGKLQTTGRIEGLDVLWVRLFPQTERLLVRTAQADGGRNHYYLCEGRTGARVSEFSQNDPKSFVRAAFLSDGRLVMAEEKGDRAELTLFSDAGQPLSTVDLGEGRRPLLGGEPSPGWLAVSLRPPGKSAWNSGPETFEPRNLLLVDLSTGRVRRDPGTAGLIPVFDQYYWASDVGSSAAPGGVLSRLLIEKEGGRSTLLELDPASGTRRVIFKSQP